MRSQLGLSYKRLSLIGPLQNTIDSLLQRQCASSIYIDLLYSGQTIINIDESIFKLTESRRMGWAANSVTSQPSYIQRLGQVAIIAAISSTGKLYFTINKGSTNSQTFLLFLIKLVKCLNSESRDWRSHTVLMLDNASYHRSKAVAENFQSLGLRTFFLGPYQYKMAPVEKLFAIIKNRDLNPLKTRIHNRQSQIEFVKELCCTVSRIDMSWIQAAFFSHLTGALQGLSLTPN